MAIGYGADQPRTTYTDTNLNKRVISDAISMITPTDHPFLSAFTPGGANEKFNIREIGTKIEWSEDDLRAQTTAMASTAASGATSLTVADGSYFKPYDIIQVDSQFFYVSAVTQSTNTLTVVSVGGTDATHSSTATITIITSASTEGAAAAYGPTTTVNQPYNYLQTLRDAVEVTRHQEKIAKYGVASELRRQRDKKMLELWRGLEKACLLEAADLRAAGSATTVRLMGSLAAFITTAGNYVTSATTITKANVDTASLYCHLDGGNPDILMLHPTAANRLRDTLDSSSFVRVSQDETELGMRLGRVQTQYHDLELIANRHMSNSYGWLLESAYIGVYTGDEFFEKDTGRAQEYDLAGALEILGDYSLVVQHGDLAHSRLYTTLSGGF